jgi:non-specific serine/threonine protein kinase
MLAKNRKIHQALIKKFHGTLIKEVGDGTLASLSLASDAVRCAMDIQKESKRQQVPLKIGIHEGEMVFEGADVLGDGVNVASRLQEMSVEGCILISGAVYRDVKNKPGINTLFMEERMLKNVDEPVKVYQVISEEDFKSDNRESSPHLIPGKKSIIVLPFENMSSDPEQEYFSDGLTEEIITDLSHVHDLLVISRNSAMTFKGTRKKTREIAREVNVRFVLEGSVRKAGNRLRITAQLIDGLHDTHLWAEKYSGTAEDVFDIQEKVSRAIVDALEVKLSPNESETIAIKPVDNFKAYEYYLKARQEYWRFTEDSLERSLQLLEEGFEMVGDNELLYAAKGTIYWQYINSMLKPGKNYPDYLNEAEVCARKVFELNPNSSTGYVLKGAVCQNNGKPGEAIQNFQNAVSNDPNNPDALMWLGYMLAASGKEEMGRGFLVKAAKLDPFNPVVQGSVGWSDFFQGNFSAALESWYKFYQMDPENPLFRFEYAWFLAVDDQKEEAVALLDSIEINLTQMKPWEQLCLLQRNALLGKKKEALQSVNQELTEAAKYDDLYSLVMAECFAMIEEPLHACEWLTNAIQYGIVHYPFLNEYDLLLENIRSDERFKKLMEEVKIKYEQFESPVDHQI